MEIWCECFGKERANLKRIDSNEPGTVEYSDQAGLAAAAH